MHSYESALEKRGNCYIWPEQLWGLAGWKSNTVWLTGCPQDSCFFCHMLKIRQTIIRTAEVHFKYGRQDLKYPFEAENGHWLAATCIGTFLTLYSIFLLISWCCFFCAAFRELYKRNARGSWWKPSWPVTLWIPNTPVTYMDWSGP